MWLGKVGKGGEEKGSRNIKNHSRVVGEEVERGFRVRPVNPFKRVTVRTFDCLCIKTMLLILIVSKGSFLLFC